MQQGEETSDAVLRWSQDEGTPELGADLTSFGATRLGVGRAFAVVGFFVRAMWLGHDEPSFGKQKRCNFAE